MATNIAGLFGNILDGSSNIAQGPDPYGTSPGLSPMWQHTQVFATASGTAIPEVDTISVVFSDGTILPFIHSEQLPEITLLRGYNPPPCPFITIKHKNLFESSSGTWLVSTKEIVTITKKT